MGVNEYMLVVAALLPAIILGVYVFIKDRVEKEPIGLLMILFLLGALSCYPAAYIEGWLIDLISKPFFLVGEVTEKGLMLSENIFKIYSFLENFIGVALVEEGLKLIVLIAVTRNNKNFNCLFDGLIYAVFVSLGFAALENVNYVLQYGWVNAFMRGVLAVPGHTFFAVIMGWQYSMGHITKKAAEEELSLRDEEIICITKPFDAKKYKLCSLLLPVAAHGLYDYCCTVDSTVAIIVFYVFIMFLYAYCFGKIKKISDYDDFSGNYVSAMILVKYPELNKDVSQTDMVTEGV